MIFYTDVVADLFHYGHLNYFKAIYDMKKEGDIFIVGVHNDEVTLSYKRTPVLTMEERIKVLEGCKYIDKIIPNSPITKTKEYIDLHKIDIIFTPSNRTDDEIKLMLEVPYKLGIIRRIPYTSSISTTDIIKRIKDRKDL